MTNDHMLRIVVHRKGRVKIAEFYLRPGDVGLSLFRISDSINCEEIIEAVHAAGKRGDLAIAEIPVSLILELGLKLVVTTGHTPDDRINRLHVEARWSRWQRLKMWFQRVPFRDRFNDVIAPRLAAVARIVSEDSP